MPSYTPEDSLIYLRHACTDLLDIAIDSIQCLDGASEEINDLAPNLGEAIDALDEIRDLIRAEAMAHNVHRAQAYSNGQPHTAHFKSAPMNVPGGGTHRQDCQTPVHPCGRPLFPIPPQPEAA